ARHRAAEAAAEDRRGPQALELPQVRARVLAGGTVIEDPRSSPVYTPEVIEEIQEKAQLGRYRIRGFGTLRAKPLPSLDDLTFLPASLTRIPLEGYREKCVTRTVIGTRFAESPLDLEIPIMI